MKNEYQKLIDEHDKTLGMLRADWLRAEPAEKGKWIERINAALDERLRLMRLRDA
jgi:hypothetical protein